MCAVVTVVVRLPGRAQVEVVRSSGPGLTDLALSDRTVVVDADPMDLPPVVDTRRVVWPLNPYAGVPLDGIAAGPVTEVSLADASSGTELIVPQGRAGPAVQLRGPIGGGLIRSAVCIAVPRCSSPRPPPPLPAMPPVPL